MTVKDESRSCILSIGALPLQSFLAKQTGTNISIIEFRPGERVRANGIPLNQGTTHNRYDVA